MCAVPDMVVGVFCCWVVRFKEYFTGCIDCCVFSVVGYYRGSQVVLFSWLVWCVHGVVCICVVVLWMAAHVRYGCGLCRVSAASVIWDLLGCLLDDGRGCGYVYSPLVSVSHRPQVDGFVTCVFNSIGAHTPV